MAQDAQVQCDGARGPVVILRRCALTMAVILALSGALTGCGTAPMPPTKTVTVSATAPVPSPATSETTNTSDEQFLMTVDTDEQNGFLRESRSYAASLDSRSNQELLVYGARVCSGLGDDESSADLGNALRTVGFTSGEAAALVYEAAVHLCPDYLNKVQNELG